MYVKTQEVLIINRSGSSYKSCDSQTNYVITILPFRLAPRSREQ